MDTLKNILKLFDLFAHRGVKHTLHVLLFCFVCRRLVSCVPNVASFSNVYYYYFFLSIFRLDFVTVLTMWYFSFHLITTTRPDVNDI